MRTSDTKSEAPFGGEGFGLASPRTARMFQTPPARIYPHSGVATENHPKDIARLVICHRHAGLGSLEKSREAVLDLRCR